MVRHDLLRASQRRSRLSWITNTDQQTRQQFPTRSPAMAAPHRAALSRSPARPVRLLWWGGAYTGAEAPMMADYAISILGVPQGIVVMSSAKLLSNETAIAVMSNTFHARRARQGTKTNPRRLVRGRDYRLLGRGRCI